VTVRRVCWIVAAALGALAAIALAAMPPPAADPGPLGKEPSWPIVKGAYHVHSNRSDGTGTIEEIAAAAARAGLQFVILTDHGNGTRAPEPPSYRSGVLCIDGVEVSTNQGHLVALGLPQLPYRLAGDARTVLEDVHRFGGFAIAAHPGSPKPALRWEAPDDVTIDGLEWLNADSEWRDEMWGSLGRGLLTYAWRPAETLATLLDRPDPVLEQWDRATRRRRVAAIAGADAHARLGLRSTNEPYDDYVVARLPSYEASFRVFVNQAILNAPLTGDAERDAAEVLDAIRQGRIVTSIDGLARLRGFEIQALGSGRTARVGEYLESPAGAGFTVSLAAPEGTTIVMLRDGERMHEVVANELTAMVGNDPAVYRFEAYLPASMGAPSIPWVVTNPIYVNMSAIHRTADPSPGEAGSRAAIATDEWDAEASPGSHSTLSRITIETGNTTLVWAFRVATEPPASPYAAIRFPIAGQLENARGLQLRAQSDRPVRISAQLRAPGEGDGRRWVQSFYLDGEARTVQLPLDRFAPVDRGDSGAPPLDRVDSLLLVVDSEHTIPGTSGRIVLSDLALIR
jgi:hypothetical protein